MGLKEWIWERTDGVAIVYCTNFFYLIVVYIYTAVHVYWWVERKTNNGQLVWVKRFSHFLIRKWEGEENDNARERESAAKETKQAWKSTLSKRVLNGKVTSGVCEWAWRPYDRVRACVRLDCALFSTSSSAAAAACAPHAPLISSHASKYWYGCLLLSSLSAVCRHKAVSIFVGLWSKLLPRVHCTLDRLIEVCKCASSLVICMCVSALKISVRDAKIGRGAS